MRVSLTLLPGIRDTPVGKGELDLRRGELERAAAEARRAEGGRELGCQVELLEDLRGGLAPLHLAVGQARP